MIFMPTTDVVVSTGDFSTQKVCVDVGFSFPSWLRDVGNRTGLGDGPKDRPYSHWRGLQILGFPLRTETSDFLSR